MKDNLEYLRIAVLLGGKSSERDISKKSGENVYQALKNQGLDVVKIDADESIIGKLLSKFADVCFNALHGVFGEDGQIQEMLESIDMPYTGSGPLASALAFDKVLSKNMLKELGVNTANFKVIHKDKGNEDEVIESIEKYPVVVKPAREGSTIGITIARNKKMLVKGMNEAYLYDKKVLVEDYLKGREITVGIFDDEPLPVIEIIADNQFYDFQAKYKKKSTKYIVPAKIDNKVAIKCQDLALKAHRLLGCRDFSRVDMILVNGSQPYILEVNTIPGLTERSLVPKAAAEAGIQFPELCMRLIDMAMRREKHEKVKV